MSHGSAVAIPSWQAASDSMPPRRRSDHAGDGTRAPGSRRTLRPSGRWRFLADVSAALDESLDFEQTLANTVRLAVPEVADYCIVALAGEGGSCRWAHAAHRDPAGRDLLDRLRARFPLQESSDHPLARAIRTGQPDLVTVEREPSRRDQIGVGRIGLLAPVSA